MSALRSRFSSSPLCRCRCSCANRRKQRAAATARRPPPYPASKPPRHSAPVCSGRSRSRSDVIAINGTLTHIVALLTDRGIALQTATATMSGVGIALIFGRILSGWCLDRMWGPYVAVTFFVLPMIGIALLASGATGAVPYLGAIALWLGIGAEVDLMAFFTSRYFGARHYAKIYGTIFGIFAFGVGIGPALSGASFDLFRSYTPVFMLYEVFLAASCVIFLRLGPYPYPAREPARADDAVKVPA